MKNNKNSVSDSSRDYDNENVEELRNEDPISGEAGAHPVGVGVGAALGGAATGAAAGALGGPIGAAVGAVVGGIAGGYAGKAAAEGIDPTVEMEHWKKEFTTRPYYNSSRQFDAYEPAYRAGVEAYDPAQPQSWDERESIARKSYESTKRNLTWDEARVAAKDAYTRVEKNCSTKPR